MTDRSTICKILLRQSLLACCMVLLSGCEYCFDAEWDVGIRVTSQASGNVVADAEVYYEPSYPDSPQPILSVDSDPSLFVDSSASTDSAGLATLHVGEGYCGPAPWALESFPTNPGYEYRVRIDADDVREVLTIPAVAGATAIGSEFAVEVVSVGSPNITWLWESRE